MIKVLFISQYLNRNGTESFMMNVFRGIDRKRFHVDFLLYSWQETDYSKEVEMAGGVVYRVPCRKESLIKWNLSLNRFFKIHATEYHAVHFCGNSLTSIAPIYYAYKYGVPVRIVHAHNSSARGFHNRLLHLLKRQYVYSLATHFFACSTLAARWFFGDKDVVIIHNGIEVARFSYDVETRRLYREKMGIEEDEVVIGHVGRFVEEKNHVFMIEVFAQYVQQCPKAKLMLIGVGPLFSEIKELVVRFNLQERVMLLGERSDVAGLMQAMDAFLMPSLFEGFPFVLIEAQAAGLPCLIADTINRDICITDNVHFASLSEDSIGWVEKLDGMLMGYKRKKEDCVIASKGYVIQETVQYLQKVYGEE